VGVENIKDMSRLRAKADASTGNTFPNIPVSTEKGRGPAVERIADHGAFVNRPPAEDDEPTAKGAAVVELAVGQNGAGSPANGGIVALGPALLEADDIGRRRESGEAAANLGQARLAQG
jgi:hypothetical protein